MEPKECAFEIMESVQEMFGQQSEQAHHEATRKYTNARMILGTHVHDHVMLMMNYFFEVEMHGVVIDEGAQVSIILNSLPSDFIPFTNNYIINKLNYGMTQILNELQTFETISGLVKNKVEANVVDKPNSSKGLKRKMAKSGKFGDKFKKTKDGSKNNNPNYKKTEKKPKGKCFHCGVDGHWKRNYPKYLTKLEEKKKGKFDLLVLEACLVEDDSSFWIVDSGATNDVCSSMQLLSSLRELPDGGLTLRVGNGALVSVKV
ncbi:hypothetical protein ZIOFF_006448 [Zingiber officinale]|uniref:Polyprotein n=1 Tax=Zingiber officinale TaxID=94328 RepID=A0A8J5HYA4_ZINOF|nr:hypothetical protein ZIOFF_006448 [Zingiber officinale]